MKNPLRSPYYWIGLACVLALVPSLLLGARLVIEFDLPFVAFVAPSVLDMLVAGWAFHKLENLK